MKALCKKSDSCLTGDTERRLTEEVHVMDNKAQMLKARIGNQGTNERAVIVVVVVVVVVIAFVVVVWDTVECVCMITPPHGCTELAANPTRANLETWACTHPGN